MIINGPLFPIQNFVATPFAGSLTGVNVKLLARGPVSTNDGQLIQPGHQSKVVSAVIDWLTTPYKGQACTFNLQSQNTASPLDQILMIYVDNELNSQNVTIGFPDTQQYIGVPAFTTGYYPVLTGGQIATVYNGTSGKIPVTANSKTGILFCNFAVPGFLSQETLAITFNSSSGPVIPSIGDKVQTNTIGSANNNPDVILATVTAPLQYVITAIEINAFNLFLSGGANGNAFSDEYYGAVYLYDANPFVTSPMRVMVFDMRAQYEDTRFVVLLDETGLNIPCQGLKFQFSDFIGASPMPIPPWCKITVSITYALVTL